MFFNLFVVSALETNILHSAQLSDTLYVFCITVGDSFTPRRVETEKFVF
jgi:hypothetical protein